MLKSTPTSSRPSREQPKRVSSQMAEQSKGSVAAAAHATPSPKIVVKSIDMGEKMRVDAIDCARAVRLPV